MAIEQKYRDLINADIDGEIGAEEKAELQAFLADSAEGRALRDELSSLCGALDAIEEEAPPVHMRHVRNRRRRAFSRHCLRRRRCVIR